MDIFLEEYRRVPPVTRIYITACVLTTAACAIHVVSPLSLYYNPRLVFTKIEVWRLVTTFLFYGPRFSIDYIFHMYFLVRYCYGLEDASFRDRSGDFLFMIVLGATVMLLASSLLQIMFLSYALNFMLVYVWSRRHPYQLMSFFGVFTFRAPYLPWVMLFLSLMFDADIKSDLLGIVVGHVYYFLEDVYPLMPDGHRILRTPALFRLLVQQDDGNAE